MMHRKTFRIMVLALCVGLLLAAVMPASADAFVSSWTGTCSSLRVIGTSDSPYVAIYAERADLNEGYFAIYPVVSGAFDYTHTFPAAPGGTLFQFSVYGALNDDVDDDDNWDEGAFWIVFDTECEPATPVSTPAPAAAPAPPVPAGFVLRTILCDTPVYDKPDGEPVGTDRVTNGQTWYVNPEYVIPEIIDGTWTEIFVAGIRLPYIPTSCIGPAPLS